MDLISQILSVGIYATVAMTFISYVFSYVFHTNFKEPQLLNHLLDTLPRSNINLDREHVLGWVIHISIGCLFVTVFKVLQIYSSVTPSLQTGLIFGAIAGIFGISVWILMFALHPNPPKIKRQLFYIQLFLAHLVFGVVMVLTLK